MGKCAICGKSTGVFSRKKICRKCNNFLNVKVTSHTENIQKMLLQINHGFKKIEPYLSRLNIVIEELGEIKYCERFIKVSYDGNIRTAQDVVDFAEKKLDDYTSEMIEKSYSLKTKNGTINKLLKYSTELEDYAFDYPRFKEIIDKNIKRVDEIVRLLYSTDKK
jgi:hypothetical protein